MKRPALVARLLGTRKPTAMPESITVRRYIAKLWHDHLKKAVPWARDQIGWAALMVVLPIIAVWMIHSSQIDWPVVRTTLWLYLAAFSIYASVHICNAIFKTYKAQEEKIWTLIDKTNAQEQEHATLRSNLTSELILREHISGRLKEAEESLAMALADIASKDVELKRCKQVPAIIKVEMQELQNRARGEVSDEAKGRRAFRKYDIFVRVKLELTNLEAIELSRIRAEMSLQGVMTQLEEIKDIDKWRLYVGYRQDGGAGWAYYYPEALKDNLKLGLPVEGWLHFVTNETNEVELEESSFRLVVETSRGASHQEWGGQTTKWYPVGNGKIVPDPDATNVGLPNIKE